jgi:RNA polymerase sigma-70 factor (ECF subfamily)
VQGFGALDRGYGERMDMSDTKNELDIAQIVSQYGAMVYRILHIRLHEPADVEDLYQEVFMRLMRSNPAFHDEDHMRAWLCRVAINLSRDLYRSGWHKHTVPISEADVLTWEEPGESEVVQAVRQLPENMRMAVHLHYYEGYAANEIARILGKKENTVYSDLSRARKKLRKILSPQRND